MGIEDLIIWTCVNLAIVVSLSVFIEVLSWGFITMADCIALDFDPVCYSVHANRPVDDVDEPMWWPHHDQADADDDGDG